jgi:anti-sigma B factor antagonist
MASELIMKEERMEHAEKVALRGEIDIYTAAQFKENLYRLVDNSVKDIVIDCGGLDYIDSTGLGIFVGALKKARLTNRNISIENLRDNIRKLFNITGLDKLFIIQ